RRACLRGGCRPAAGGGRVAWPLPAFLDPAPGGASDRAGPGQTGAPGRKSERDHEGDDRAMIDVTQQINAVRRQVGTRVLDAGEARTVTVSQSYAAAVEDVWDACTNPERIPRWFLPITGDLRAGGPSQLQGNAGGPIERRDPPRSFAATWEFGGQVSWIEVRLMAEAGDRTRLVLEHVAHVDDEQWAEFGPGAVGIGWDMGFMGLAMHLSSGRPAD